MDDEYNAGTLNITADETSLRAQESRAPKGLFDKAAGWLFGGMFLAAAVFFWIMPVANPAEVFWLRVILCGGLALIGGFLIWGTMGPKTKFDFVEVDRDAGVLISGRDTPSGRQETNRMKLSAIERVQVGSGQLSDRNRSGYAALYVIGDGAPRKGILLTAGYPELEQVQRHIDRLRQ